MDGNIQSGMPNAGTSGTAGPAPVVGEGWVQLGGTEGKKIFWDELSKADQNLVLQYLYFLSAQVPILTPPQAIFTPQEASSVGSVGGVSVGTVAVLTAQKKHDIIMNMLDGWIKNIQEITAQSEKDYQKKTIDAMDTAFRTYRDHGNPIKDPNFPLFSVGLIIVGTGITQAMLPNNVDAAVTQIGINPVLNMYTHAIVANMNEMVALGMIGAIYGAGVQYFTVAEIAAKGAGDGGGKEKPKDSVFAQGYAKNMMNLVKSESFNSYLTAIVTQNIPKGGFVSPESTLERAAMVKMILLSSALAIIYQAEAGKMTGEEFAGMLNNTIKFEDGNIRAQLVSLIKANLNLIQDPKVRGAIVNSLLEFFDTDPSIETLSKPAELFKKLGAKVPRGDLSG
jgi:hypothetical protein